MVGVAENGCLKEKTELCGDEEAAFAHDLFFALSDSSQMLKPRPTTSMWVPERPGRAGVLAVGIAEGDVDAGKFFVLEDVADDALDAEVGADGEFADAVGVLVGVGVGPEVASSCLFALEQLTMRLPAISMVSGVDASRP